MHNAHLARPTPVHLESLNIGRAEVRDIGGRPVATAIGKRATEGTVAVRPLGLEGDEQADLSVHGGLSKAVYAYPLEHYPVWQTLRAQAGTAAWGAPLLPDTLAAGQTAELVPGPREIGIAELFRAKMGRGELATAQASAG